MSPNAAVQNIIVYNNNMTFTSERGQFSRRSFIPDCSHFNFQSHVTHESASGAQVMSQVYDFIAHTVTHILCCPKHHKPFLFSYQLSTPAPSSRILSCYLGPDINLGI